MPYTFKLSGAFTAEPDSGTTSGNPSTEVVLADTIRLTKRHSTVMDLTSDSAASIGFGGLTNAHVISIRASGGKIRVRLTSTDGSTQAIPVDPYVLVLCREVPVTAIDLTRVAGTSTTVFVFLGEE